MENKVIGFQHALLTELRHFASERGQPVSAVVREAVRYYLDINQPAEVAEMDLDDLNDNFEKAFVEA